jgi:hypothetical protein
MRIAIDVCVSTAVELELWRAGYKIPVRAAAGEPDPDWLSRALNAGCQVVITMDRGAAAHATRAGMVSVLIPMFTTAHDMPGTVFDAMEEVEERIRAAERPARILAPIAALGLLLAACAPRPAVVEPAASPTPHCFSVRLAWDGKTEAGLACGSTADVCESVRRRAARWGGAAGIKEVGSCKRDR